MIKPDYMSETEFKDLEEMKVKCNQSKIEIMEYMISMLRYTPQDFLHSGYRNGLGQALETNVKRCKDTIDKLNKEYIKKYPD